MIKGEGKEKATSPCLCAKCSTQVIFLLCGSLRIVAMVLKNYGCSHQCNSPDRIDGAPLKTGDDLFGLRLAYYQFSEPKREEISWFSGSGWRNANKNTSSVWWRWSARKRLPWGCKKLYQWLWDSFEGGLPERDMDRRQPDDAFEFEFPKTVIWCLETTTGMIPMMPDIGIIPMSAKIKLSEKLGFLILPIPKTGQSI